MIRVQHVLLGVERLTSPSPEQGMSHPARSTTDGLGRLNQRGKTMNATEQDLVVTVTIPEGCEGTAYRLTLPNGQSEVIDERGDHYWQLAAVIDDVFPVVRDDEPDMNEGCARCQSVFASERRMTDSEALDALVKAFPAEANNGWNMSEVGYIREVLADTGRTLLDLYPLTDEQQRQIERVREAAPWMDAEHVEELARRKEGEPFCYGCNDWHAPDEDHSGNSSFKAQS